MITGIFSFSVQVSFFKLTCFTIKFKEFKRVFHEILSLSRFTAMTFDPLSEQSGRRDQAYSYKNKQL